MKLLIVLPLLVAIYCVLQFGLLKFLTKQKGGDSLRKVGLAGVIAGIKLVRDSALIATIVYAVLAVLIVGYGMLFGSNAQFLLRLVQVGEFLAVGLKSSRKIIENAIFVLLMLGLVYLCVVHYRTHLISLFRRRYDEDLLRAQAADSSSEPESDETHRLKAALAEAETAFEKLNHTSASEGIDWHSRQGWLKRIKSLNDQLAAERQRIRLAAIHDSKQESKKSDQKWYRRLARVFVSKGLYSDLKFSSKILSRLTAATVALGLVALSGPVLANSVWQRMLRLDDLRVAAVKAHIEKEIEQTKSPQPPNITPEDIEAVQYLNAQFGRALVNNSFWRFNISPDQVDAGLRRETTARAIVERGQVHGSDVSAGKSARSSASLSDADAKTVNAVSESKAAKAARTAVSQEAEVVSWFGERWGTVRENLLAHARKYGQPVGFSDVRGAVVDRIVGLAFDQPEGAADDIISKTARDALKSVAKQSVKEAVEIEFKQTVVDLKQGANLDDVLVKVRTKRLAIPVRQTEGIALAFRNVDETGLAARLKRAGFGLRLRPDAGVDVHKAESVAQEIAEELGKKAKEPVPQHVVEALDDYDHHFPSTESRPPDVEPPSSVTTSDPPSPNKGGPGSLSSQSVVQRVNNSLGRAQPSAGVSRAFQVARAHNFQMLRGFSRVGGVLIGREPSDSSSTVDFSDLRWDVAGRQLTLVFVRKDGRQFALGPYDKSLIHQALVYVADGRPLAVTMTTASPLPDLKILLHPALMDTPLGCRIIDLDRWVDQYARQNNDVNAPEQRVYDEVFLYNVAWTRRLGVLVSKIKFRSDVSASDVSNLEARLEEQQYAVDSPESKEVKSRVEARFPTSAEILDSKRSLLAAKREFYDPELVTWTAECAKRGSVDGFKTCIDEKAADAANAPVSEFAARWITEPPVFQLWSGVRELDYDVCADLSCFVQPPSTDGTLWPLDFMVQAAFTSPPAFLSEEQAGASPDQYIDRVPFEFPHVHEKVVQHLTHAVRRDPDLQNKFSIVRDFAVLQRLFRVALRGDMGPDFPLERLLSLTSVSAGSIPFCRTSRWNARSLELRVAQTLRHYAEAIQKTETAYSATPDGTVGRLLSQIGGCEALLARESRAEGMGNAPLVEWLLAKDRDESLAEHQRNSLMIGISQSLAQISDEKWSAACRFTDLIEPLASECNSSSDMAACLGAQLAERSTQWSRNRRLAKALRVGLDLGANAPCPSLDGSAAGTNR